MVDIFLKANQKRAVKPVIVDGQKIFVREMFVEEIREYSKKKNGDHAVLCACLCDEDGNRVIKDEDFGKYAFKNKQYNTILEVFKELNGEDEDTEKN